ncbi:MAG: cytochrome C biogenesis protein [Lysobacterales bacterium CG02_land_8_20_14_3_00_62_12]|nr:MAG: cytochrome C biogenesis protein [Xanthomonadales bacterium CG02_land_8_20_14_3_00_62_12]
MSSLTRSGAAFGLLFAGLVASSAWAIDSLTFSSTAQEQRFQALTQELRCLVCQNQNLADSDAELARDLRLEVYEMLVAGKSNAEIKGFLVDRYGEFVLYQPPVRGGTIALWFGPIALLIFGFFLARRWWRRPTANPSAVTASGVAQNGDNDPGEFP